jgi:hypothetical protein
MLGLLGNVQHFVKPVVTTVPVLVLTRVQTQSWLRMTAAFSKLHLAT